MLKHGQGKIQFYQSHGHGVKWIKWMVRKSSEESFRPYFVKVVHGCNSCRTNSKSLPVALLHPLDWPDSRIISEQDVYHHGNLIFEMVESARYKLS